MSGSRWEHVAAAEGVAFAALLFSALFLVSHSGAGLAPDLRRPSNDLLSRAKISLKGA
jgi:hypothetical protein